MAEEVKVVDSKTKWWKFALALIVFWIGPLVIGAGLSIFLSISNIFTPRAYAMSQDWINLVSSVLACLLCASFADKITDEKHKIFCMTNCVIAATIWIGDTVLSTAMQTIEFVPALLQVARAVAYIIFAVMMYRESKSAPAKTEAEQAEEL